MVGYEFKFCKMDLERVFCDMVLDDGVTNIVQNGETTIVRTTNINHIHPTGDSKKQRQKSAGPAMTATAIRSRAYRARHPDKVLAANKKRAAQRKEERKKKKEMRAMEKIPAVDKNSMPADFINFISGETRGTNYVVRKEVKIVETINYYHEKVVPVTDENEDYEANKRVYLTIRGDLRRAQSPRVRGGDKGAGVNDA